MASQTLHTRKGNFHYLYNATVGLVLFGTPHLGSGVGSQFVTQPLKKIAKVAFTKVPAQLDAALTQHSNELSDLGDNFRSTTLWTEKRLEIYTYYETKTVARIGSVVCPLTA